MLVLTRRPNRGDGSTIIIERDISIVVLSTENGSVKLGITAPEQIRIDGSPERGKTEKWQEIERIELLTEE